MPLHDFRCETCHAVCEHLVKSGTETMPCHHCQGTAHLVFLTPAKPFWTALAQGDSASPEAVDKFEKMHKEQAAKEKSTFEEHGDYGPRPGAD